jgi:hypothetical protein
VVALYGVLQGSELPHLTALHSDTHPEATDEEMWELFRQAAEDDDEVRGAVEKLHLKTLRDY